MRYLRREGGTAGRAAARGRVRERERGACANLPEPNSPPPAFRGSFPQTRKVLGLDPGGLSALFRFLQLRCLLWAGCRLLTN